MRQTLHILTLTSIFFLFGSFHSVNRQMMSQVEASTGNICELGGVVFIEPVAGFADYKVFIEDNEAFAEMLVFTESSSGFADRPGLWYVTDIRSMADFTVSFVDVKAFANFSIFYTQFRSLAGCKK